jgi:hypothetical protein
MIKDTDKKMSWIAGAIILLAVVIVSYQYGKFSSSQSHNPQANILIAEDTADWKTYNSSKLGFTFKYPPEWQEPVERTQSTHTLLDFSHNDADFTVRIGFNFNQETGKNSTFDQAVNLESTNAKSTSDYVLGGIQGKKIVHGMGASSEQVYIIIQVPNTSAELLEIQYTIPNGDIQQSNIFDQILSTFTFLDSKDISVTEAPLTKLHTISTDGWQTVSLNGLQFKIPPTFRFEDKGEGVGWLHAPPSIIPGLISVVEYKGGSRREQFLGKDPQDCHYIFEDAMFGSVKALRIAADGAYCQGGAGGIAAVVGDKFFTFKYLYYDLETKKIDNDDIRDTIISTLKNL